MLPLTFFKGKGAPLSLLFLGAHSDDIEIGCGGTVLRILGEHPGSNVNWVVFSAKDGRAEEAEVSAGLLLNQAGNVNFLIKDFDDGFFPYIGADIKRFFEELKSTVAPDVIFTHYRNDLHQDHRLISELTWNTFRNHLILEYEVIKYDGDLGAPNFFISLTEEQCRRKVDSLMGVFPSQRQRKWFSKDTFLSIMRLRGLEANAPENFAEAFYCRKMVF